MLTLSHPVVPVPAIALFRRSAFRPVGEVATVCPIKGDLMKGLAVLQLGFSRDDAALLSETMLSLGARNVARSEQVHPLGLGKPGTLRYDGIVINLDRYADIEMGVDRLMRFRRACPGSFVVLATAGVAADDFGRHRSAICDSTLKLPITSSRLAEVLEAALVNHGGVKA